MNTRVITLIMFFMGLLLLNGCSGSGSGDSLDGAKNQPPTFPPEPPAPFEPAPTQPAIGKANDDIVVRVEATDKMIASWQDHIFEMITPAKAYAFRGLSAVEARSVEVVQVNRSLSALPNPTVNIAHTTKQNADGTYSINFVERGVPTRRIDLLVRVQLNNGEILWSPVIFDGSVLKVNIVSSYIVETMFALMRDKNMSLSNLLPCGEEYGCENQNEARSILWQGLIASAQQFDTTIPADSSLSGARTFLSKQVDFMNFVDTGIKMVLDYTYVDAIAKEIDFQNILNSESLAYNTIFFSMGVANDTPDDDIAGAILTNRSASVTSKAAGDGSIVNAYPAISENEFPTTITYRSVIGDIPFIRNALTLTEGGDNKTDSNLGAEINSFKSDPSSSFLGTDGVTRYGRVPYQTITGQNSTNIVGWLTNPFFSDFFAGTDRNYLVAAPVSTGRAYKLSKQSDNKYLRSSVLEESADFNYMVHLQSTPEGNFDAVAISDQKTYGVVSLAQQIATTGNTLNQLSVSTKKWRTNAGIISESQTSDGLPGHYSTLTISRDNAFVPSGPTETTTTSQAYGLMDSLVNTYDTATKQLVDKAVGRIELEQGGQTVQEGALTPDGKQIATYKSNQSNRNKGFNHGVQLTGATPDITESEFYLQGHLFTIEESTDELSSLSGSTISIDETQLATLSLRQQYKSINVGTKAVSDLQKKQNLASEPTAALIQNGQQVQLTFTDIFGKELVLKGFISADGNLLTLTAQMGNGIGVIYGFRKQDLPLS